MQVYIQESIHVSYRLQFAHVQCRLAVELCKKGIVKVIIIIVHVSI